VPSPITNFEQVFLAKLPLIESHAAAAARRKRFPQGDAEDFVSHVKIRLIENDYAKLRQYRGESSIEGFLAVIISNLCEDYADHLWGKWRTPGGVKKLGPLATLLHRLTTRERLPLEAAYETLWTNYGVTDTRAELDALAARLPQRTDRQFEGEDALEATPSQGKQPDDIAAGVESVRTGLRAEAELKRAMAALPAEDRLLLVLHYRDGVTVSEIARRWSRPHGPLRERLKKAERQIGDQLRAAALDAATVIPLLEAWCPNLEWDEGSSDKNVGGGPSIKKGAQT